MKFFKVIFLSLMTMSFASNIECSYITGAISAVAALNQANLLYDNVNNIVKNRKITNLNFATNLLMFYLASKMAKEDLQPLFDTLKKKKQVKSVKVVNS